MYSPYAQLTPVLDAVIGKIGVDSTLVILRKIGQVNEMPELPESGDYAQQKANLVADFIFDRVAKAYQCTLADIKDNADRSNRSLENETAQDARLLVTCLIEEYTKWTMSKIGKLFEPAISRQAVRHRINTARQMNSSKAETKFRRLYKEVSTEIAIFLAQI